MAQKLGLIFFLKGYSRVRNSVRRLCTGMRGAEKQMFCASLLSPFGSGWQWMIWQSNNAVLLPPLTEPADNSSMSLHTSRMVSVFCNVFDRLLCETFVVYWRAQFLLPLLTLTFFSLSSSFNSTDGSSLQVSMFLFFVFICSQVCVCIYTFINCYS